MHKYTYNVYFKLFKKFQLEANLQRYVDISSIYFFRYIDFIDDLNGVSMTALETYHVPTCLIL